MWLVLRTTPSGVVVLVAEFVTSQDAGEHADYLLDEEPGADIWVEHVV